MKNILSSIFNIFVSLVVGIYIPKLFLEYYGPSLHGCISTANNLSNYVLLLTAGLTTAAVQALYSPMSVRDHNRVSAIYNAIKNSYRSISLLIFLGFVVLAIVVPFIIGDEIQFILVILIYLLLGLQYYIDNLWLKGFTAIVRADDKISIINNLNTATYLLQAIVQVIIIKSEGSIIFFQATPVLIVILKYLFLNRYVKRHYSFIDTQIAGDSKALDKRWNAFIHQISGLVLFNTDTLLLTLACTQKIVSVYVIYNLVFIYMYSFLLQTCSTSIVASIGRAYFSKPIDLFISYVKQYECIYMLLVSVAYSVASITLLSFISLYTKNVEGISYLNVTYGLLFIIGNVLSAVRIPSMTIVDAVGHYKETQNQAIIEAIINLSISICLVFNYGIIGVLIGTICSFLYRSFAMIVYQYKNILTISYIKQVISYIIIIINVIAIYILYNYYLFVEVNSWAEWFVLAALAILICSLESLLLVYIIDRTNLKIVVTKSYLYIYDKLKL